MPSRVETCWNGLISLRTAQTPRSDCQILLICRRCELCPRHADDVGEFWTRQHCTCCAAQPQFVLSSPAAVPDSYCWSVCVGCVRTCSWTSFKRSAHKCRGCSPTVCISTPCPSFVPRLKTNCYVVCCANPAMTDGASGNHERDFMNSGDRYNNDTFTENYDRQECTLLSPSATHEALDEAFVPFGAAVVSARRISPSMRACAVVVSAVWCTTTASRCRSLQALRLWLAAISSETTPRAHLSALTSSRCGAHAPVSLRSRFACWREGWSSHLRRKFVSWV